MRWLLLLISIQCYGADKFETFCLTQNIYHEARGETLEGKVAIGYVTLNRVQNSNFPNSICEVVYDSCQFSWSCDSIRNKPIDLEEWYETQQVALNVLNGVYPNNVKNSYYYYNPRKANPHWKKKYCKNTVKIDQHNFCITSEK